MGVNDTEKWYEKLKFSRHQTIQRLGVFTAVMSVTGLALVGGVAAGEYRDNKDSVSATAIYTPKFTTKYTNQQGVVSGVYTNSTKTRALVVAKFDSGSQMNINADNYRAFITGIDKNQKPQAIKKPFSGRIYSFGAAQTLGFVLEAPEGLPEQVLNFTVMSESDLVARDRGEEKRVAEESGGNYVAEDHFRFIVNPAADSAEYMADLDNDTLDVTHVYNRVVQRDAEVTLRKEAMVSLSYLYDALESVERAEEAARQTKLKIGNNPSVGLMLPERDASMRGDTITGASSDEVQQALNEGLELTDPNNPLSALTEYSDSAKKLDLRILEDSQDIYNTYTLNTTSIVPGGYNFDWRKISLDDSYLDRVVPSNVNPRDYFKDHELSQISGGSYGDTEMEWRLSDGSLLSAQDKEDPNVMQLITLASSVRSAYSEYYKLKAEYQRSILGGFLLTEADSRSAADTATVNTNENAITLNTNV